MNPREALESLLEYANNKGDTELAKEIRNRYDLVLAAKFPKQLAKTPELDKEIHIDNVEKWIRESVESSFDAQKGKDLPPYENPEPERVNTSAERFILSRTSLIKAVTLIRRYHHLYRPPSNWDIPKIIAECFANSKQLYSVVLTTEFALSNLIKHKNDRLSDHKERIDEVSGKLAKLTMFVEQTNKLLHEMQTTLGEVTQEVENDYNLPKPTKQARQIAGEHDRAPRPAQSRKDSTRKPFSLTDLLASKRSGS